MNIERLQMLSPSFVIASSLLRLPPLFNDILPYGTMETNRRGRLFYLTHTC